MASQERINAISWTKDLTSRGLAVLDRSWLSLASKLGCWEMWTFEGSSAMVDGVAFYRTMSYRKLLAKSRYSRLEHRRMLGRSQREKREKGARIIRGGEEAVLIGYKRLSLAGHKLRT